jgi:hypothetical protein
MPTKLHKDLTGSDLHPSKAGGSTTQVQFNDGGTINGATALAYDKTTGKLTHTVNDATVPVEVFNQQNVPVSGESKAVIFQFGGVDTLVLRQGTAGGGYTDLRLTALPGKAAIHSLIASNGTDYADWTYDGNNMELETNKGDINIRPGLDTGMTHNVNIWSLSHNAKLRVGNQNFTEALDFQHDGTHGLITCTTGIKIGTTTSQQLGFYGATPIARPAALSTANATATNGTIATSDTILNNVRTRLNELESRFQSLGLLS